MAVFLLRKSWRPNMIGFSDTRYAADGSLGAPRWISIFVLLEVDTLGVAPSLGWKVHMRCASGYRLKMRSMRRCVYRRTLDLETLVATRGPNFPLGRSEGRLMCPACGNRRVTVVFEPPSNAARMGGG